TEAQVANAAAVARADISADPVVVELVVIGTGADAHAAGPGRSTREQFVTRRRVIFDHVVVDVHVELEAVRQLRVGRELRSARVRGIRREAGTRVGVARGPIEVRLGRLALTKDDAARERSG